MEITEVRIKLMRNRKDKLKAFCSITIDNAFVIRDLKIIEGLKGAFVAMPSRKLAERCVKCSTKNHLRAKFCNECGADLADIRKKNMGSHTKLHADIAHPINTECREQVQSKILDAYRDEVKRVYGEEYEPAIAPYNDRDTEEYDVDYDDDENGNDSDEAEFTNFEEDDEDEDTYEEDDEGEDDEGEDTYKEDSYQDKGEKKELEEVQKKTKEDEFGAGIFS